MRWLFLSFAFVSLAAAQRCYVPDGSINPDAYPIDNSTEFSACCQANQEGFTNGLCKSPGDGQINWFWRVGCTDPSYEDESCPKFCEQFGDDEWVTNQCDATTFCCAIKGNPGDPVYIRSNYTCCQNEAATFQLPELEHQSGPIVYKSGLWLVENPAFFVNGPLSSTPSAIATPTAAVSSGEPSNTPTDSITDAAATTTPPSGSPTDINTDASQAGSSQSSTSSSSNKTALGVGLGVGIPLGIAALAGLAFLAWRHHRKHYQRRHTSEAGFAAGGAGADEPEKLYSPYTPQQQQQQYQQPLPHAAYAPTYPPSQHEYYAAPKVAAVSESHAQPVYEMPPVSQRHEVDGAHPVWKRS